MERFPVEPAEPFDPYGFPVEPGPPETYDTALALPAHYPEDSETDILRLGFTEANSQTPVDAQMPPPEYIPAAPHTNTPVQPYQGPAFEVPKNSLERFAGLMTETFLDVVLPFDWPRSEMTVSPGADINNPASEPNRKPSWHEYFESGPEALESMFK